VSVSDTISQIAVANPIVGVAVAAQSTNSAILAGLQSGDTAASALLGVVNGQALEVNQLLAGLMPNLGQNVNTVA